MAGSVIGTMFRVTTFGESHGRAVGAVIDGCPAGLSLSEEIIGAELAKRRPGAAGFFTQRLEDDIPAILSGVFNGVTLGTPICVIIENRDHKPSEYEGLKDIYRPSHADYTYQQKYGHRDYRGGGRASGRETAARVAAGAVAKQILKEVGIDILAYTLSLGKISVKQGEYQRDDVLGSATYMPDKEAAKNAEIMLEDLRTKGDSCGGVIVCRADGLCAGLGEPVFDKLDAELAKAIMSIGAVKGIEFGSGFLAAKMAGSEHNDEFCGIDGNICKKSNNSGGVLGGISDGSSLVFRTAVKPVPSISLPQRTTDVFGKETELTINGRHDVTAVPRIVPVVEAMTAIVLCDMLLRNQTANIKFLRKQRI